MRLPLIAVLFVMVSGCAEFREHDTSQEFWRGNSYYVFPSRPCGEIVKVGSDEPRWIALDAETRLEQGFVEFYDVAVNQAQETLSCRNQRLTAMGLPPIKEQP